MVPGTLSVALGCSSGPRGRAVIFQASLGSSASVPSLEALGVQCTRDQQPPHSTLWRNDCVLCLTQHKTAPRDTGGLRAGWGAGGGQMAHNRPFLNSQVTGLGPSAGKRRGQGRGPQAAICSYTCHPHPWSLVPPPGLPTSAH